MGLLDGAHRKSRSICILKFVSSNGQEMRCCEKQLWLGWKLVRGWLLVGCTCLFLGSLNLSCGEGVMQQAFRHVRKLQREVESGILGVGRGEEGVSRDGEGAGRWEGIRRPC